MSTRDYPYAIILVFVLTVYLQFSYNKSDNEVFLKSIIPSRKLNKVYEAKNEK